MAGRLKTTIKTSVRVTQRISVVKRVIVAGMIFLMAGAAFFVYLNIGNSEDAEAGNNLKKMSGETEEAFHNAMANAAFVDLSHLTADEMELLNNRDFNNDTTRKEYASVKWNVNSSMSHLTLEMHNLRHEFSLELFDLNGSSLLYFANLREEKVFVDKVELAPNHEFTYLVRNSVGEMYAGNFSF